MRVQPDVREREPAHPDQAEEALGAGEPAVILVRATQVPVGDDEAQHRVEHFERLAHVERRLVREVVLFNSCCEEALYALFGRLFDVVDVVDDSVQTGETGPEKEDSSGMLVKILSTGIKLF